MSTHNGPLVSRILTEAHVTILSARPMDGVFGHSSCEKLLAKGDGKLTLHCGFKISRLKILCNPKP